MEGNAISAAFTALWRGLDDDKNSANIAIDILSQEQIEVMKRARFAPALQALVKARGDAVDYALLKLISVNNIDSYNIFPKQADQVFQAFLLCRHSFNIEAILIQLCGNYGLLRANLGSL